MLKNNKGITLTALVITIIILLILASVATVSGIGAIDYVKFNNAKAQFQTMQAHVNSWYEDYKVFCAEVDKDTTLTEGQKATKKDEWIGKDINISNLDATLVYNTLYDEEKGTSDATGYRYFSSDYIKNDLDIDGISYDFLINVSNGTVLLYGGITYQDKTYYSAEDFGINSVNYTGVSGEITFEITQKDNSFILYDIQFSNNMKIGKYNVKYKMKGEDFWNNVTADMKYIYEYEKDGKKIIDENAWKINIQEKGAYDFEIITSSDEIKSKIYSKATNAYISPECYGDLVDYKIDIDNNEATNDWQIFYSDKTNIWIIAKEYVKIDQNNPPNGFLETSSNNYRIIWKNYNGDLPYNVAYTNIMTDPENWKLYVDSDYAEKAYGGPTIEMFAESYNEKYPNENKIRYEKQEDGEYKVAREVDGVTNYQNINNQWITDLTMDSPYIITKQNLAYAYWLATPTEKCDSTTDKTYLLVATHNGGIYGRTYNPGGLYGLRPVVCLKSNVSLTYDSVNKIWNLSN